MTAVTTTQSNSTIEIVESVPGVSIAVTESTIHVQESAPGVQVLVAEAPVSVSASEQAASTVIAIGTVEVKVEIPALALSTVLDEVRTDAADTSYVYDANDQVISTTSSDVSRSLTYNPDGTVATVTTVTATKSVTKTFGYTDGNLTSITVS